MLKQIAVGVAFLIWASVGSCSRTVDTPFVPWGSYDSVKAILLLDCPQARIDAGESEACHVVRSWKTDLSGYVKVRATFGSLVVAGSDGRTHLLAGLRRDHDTVELHGTREFWILDDTATDEVAVMIDARVAASPMGAKLASRMFFDTMKVGLASSHPEIQALAASELAPLLGPWCLPPEGDLGGWLDAYTRLHGTSAREDMRLFLVALSIGKGHAEGSSSLLLRILKEQPEIVECVLSGFRQLGLLDDPRVVAALQALADSTDPARATIAGLARQALASRPKPSE